MILCVFVCGWFLVLGSFGRLSHNDLRSKVVSEITTFPVSKALLKREVGTRTSMHATAQRTIVAHTLACIEGSSRVAACFFCWQVNYLLNEGFLKRSAEDAQTYEYIS